MAALSGCNSGGDPAAKNDASTSTATSPGSSGDLKIALVPAEDAEKMAEAFEPIKDQIAKDTGKNVTVANVTDYGSVIEAMRAGKVDIAWYGPLSMVLANQEAGALPFAVPEIEGTGDHYFSLIVTKKGSGINKIEDLKGKKLALVDPGSTSGNLVPRAAIKKATGKTVEELVSHMSYAGSHDASLLALVSGSVDACAVQDITFNDQVTKKQIDPAQYTIVFKSDPLPQSPLAYRKDLDPALVDKIKKSLYGDGRKHAAQDVPGMGKVVRFVPADMKLFQPIKDMADGLHLTKEQMLKK